MIISCTSRDVVLQLAGSILCGITSLGKTLYCTLPTNICNKLNSLRTCIGNFTDGKRTKANGGNHCHHKCKWAEVNGRFLHFSPSHFFTSMKQLMTLESIKKKKKI
ncbi:hypothetical protein Peur_018476 [Populus x canadensis]